MVSKMLALGSQPPHMNTLVGVVLVTKFVQVGSHREPANATRLDLFLAEAKAKGFPLEYTWMDCALRGYGVFVMWMHLVVYLIFRYIHGDAYDRKDIGFLEERPSAKPTAFTPTTQVTAATPKAKAAKEGSKIGSSSRSSRKSKKKSRKSGKKGKKHANSKDEEEDDAIEDAGTQASERIPLEVVYPQRLKLMKEFIVDYKKDIESQKQKPEKEMPSWVTTFDLEKGGSAESALRQKMRDWLFRLGGTDVMPSKERTREPSREQPSTEQPSREQPEPRARLPSRAPRGHQMDKLASMDRFLEKLETVEGPSSRERYSQEGLLEVAQTQSTCKSLEVAATPPSEHLSIRDMIVSMQEPFVATANATATNQSTLYAKGPLPPVRPNTTPCRRILDSWCTLIAAPHIGFNSRPDYRSYCF